MKFGELLAKSLISGWEAHYFDYWMLKEYIKRNTMELEGRKPVFNHQEFASMYLKEERRVALFVNGKLAEIVNELEFEMSRTEGYNLAVAQQLGAQVIKFDRFVNDAFNAQQKILKKYRKWTGQHTGAWFDEKNCSMMRAKNIVHSLIVSLSQLSERQWETADSWCPPETFVRKTVKYWVRPEHAAAAKLFIIQHIPILEVNKTPAPPRSLEVVDAQSQIHNFLSSVYMDNDTADCYHRRIALEEGANLLRVRWYGGDEGPDGLPRPNSGSIFFMELKTHHNADQSGLKSTKERFPITAQMIPGFMSGKLDADKVVDAMAAQGHIKLAKVDEQKELAAFIQKLITTMGLKPWIRTVYHRTAFQRSDSNEVRISFDLPLILHPELPNWNGKDWMDLFKVDNSNAPPFGYGILEVKTSEAPPAWVEELLATGWLIHVEKFSKFQHATFLFHEEATRVKPYWIGSDIARKIDNEFPDHAAQLVEKTIHKSNASNLSTGSGGNGAESAGTVAVHVSPRSPTKQSKHQTYDSIPQSPPRSMPRSPLRGDGDLFEPLLSLNSDDRSHRLKRSSNATNKADDVMSLRTVKTEMSCGSPTKPPPPPVPKRETTNLTRMRVEPKVFFANERTFLKWMFAVVILISVSMTVLSINQKSIPYGVALLVTACVLIIYAVGLYRWRLTRILRREGTRFDDRVGPFLIAFCLLAAACVVFAFAWSSSNTDVFVCQRTLPSCQPINPDPSSTVLEIYGFNYPDIQTTIARLESCVLAEEADDTEDNGASDSGKGTKPKKKNSANLKPVIVWDVNNTFLVPSTSTDPAIAYLKYEEDLQKLTFNIRNDSMYFNVLQTYMNQRVGVVVNTTRADCNVVYNYASIAVTGVTQPPATSDEINQRFNIPFFTEPTALTVESNLRSRYTFSNVRLADQKATITVLPQFLNVDDRAMQTNSIDTRVTIEFTRMVDEEFRYSAMRQAQSLLQALLLPDERHEDLKARWK